MSTVVLALVLLGGSLASADPGAECRITLPGAVSSFGGEGVGEHLYVYSGHIGRTHAHSANNLHPGFSRLSCDGTVEELPMRDPLQGTALVSHDGRLILVGGLQAFNPTLDAEEDLVSTAAVRRFDPATGVWEDLPPMPTPRSSHDAVVLDGVLWVVGGWTLRGRELDPVWPDTVLALDLENPRRWKTIWQPFRRRALAVTHDGSRLVVVGGLDGAGDTSNRVDLYDVAERTWIEAPDLPAGGGMKSFGAAAEHHLGHALASAGDGAVHALEWPLEGEGPTWRRVGELGTPRFFHELAVVGGELLALGGASRSGHLADVETVALDLEQNPVQPAEDDQSPVQPSPLEEGGARWAGFRHAADPPSEVGAEAVRWRVPLEGYGQSAPTVWSDRVFVATTTGEQMETQHLCAYRRADGERLWKVSFASTEPYEFSDMIAKAASTPLADSERVYVLYGSGDLVAVRHDGAVVWQRDLAGDYGTFAGNHGVGSSPLRTEDAVVVHIARKSYAYLLALDPATGETLWKTDREAGPGWTTPVLTADGDEIVVGASGWLEGYDARSGERLWALEGLGGNNVSSPVVEDGLIAVAATRSGGVSVVRRAGDGAPRIVWQADFKGHYGSPVLAGGCLLVSNNVGGLVCFDPETGEERGRQRIAGPTWATPIVDGSGRVVFVAEKGQVQVTEPSTEGLEVVQELELETEGRLYGAVAVGAELVLRSGEELLLVR